MVSGMPYGKQQKVNLSPSKCSVAETWQTIRTPINHQKPWRPEGRGTTFFPSADRKEQSSQNYFELIKFPSGLNKLQEIGKEKNSKEIYTKC